MEATKSTLWRHSIWLFKVGIYAKIKAARRFMLNCVLRMFICCYSSEGTSVGQVKPDGVDGAFD